LNNWVVSFRRGLCGGRITPGKNRPSCTDMPLPEDVVKLLREWQSSTPYNQPHDWVFASSVKEGKTPLDRFCLMKKYIQPVVRKLGLPHISWHSFRHSLSSWGKACLTAEDRKVLLRHGTTASGEGYGEVSLEKKDEIAQRFRTHVRLAAKQNVVGPATSFSTRNGRRGPGVKKAAAAAENQPAPYLSHARKKRVG